MHFSPLNCCSICFICSGDYHSDVVGTAYWMAPECLNGKPYCEQVCLIHSTFSNQSIGFRYLCIGISQEVHIL